MVHLRYLLVGFILITCSCGLKKPVENEKVLVRPGEKVKLFKDRGLFAELYFVNETGSDKTVYIEALGDVWGYDSTAWNTGAQHPNISDKIRYQ